MAFRAGEQSRRTVAVAVVLAAVLLSGAAAADLAFASEGDPDAIEPDPAAGVEIDRAVQTAEGQVEVVVRFESVDRATVQASDDAEATLRSKAETAQRPLERYAARTAGVEFEKGLWIANAALVTVDTEEVPVEALGRIDGVDRLHENAEVKLAETRTPTADRRHNVSAASDPEYGLEQINATEVWSEYDTKGEGATVAVLDTGIEVANHSDLELIEGGWKDYVNGKDEPYDDESHGTHVSGTIGGDETGWGEQYGVAPDVGLLHAKVLDEEGVGNRFDILDAMQWATEHEADVDVISMSLGSNGYSDAYVEPVRNAKENGITVVAAAGNSEEGSSGSPGNVHDSFGIGASNESHGIADFSSGELVADHDFDDPPNDWPDEWIVPDVAAPGSWILSAYPNGDYGYKSGTSMATPHVAGAIALMQSATAEDLEPTEIEDAFEETAWKPGGWNESEAEDVKNDKDSRYGDGIIDAKAAISEVKPGTFEGRVVDEATEEPIEGVTVTAEAGDETEDAKTDSDGAFAIEVDGDDEYELTVAPKGYDRITESHSVEASETKDVGNLTLKGNASFDGTVTDDVTGTQLENATVTATTERGGQTYEAETDADGTYAFDALGGGVDYELAVSAPGYAEHTSTITIGDNASATADVGLAGDSTVAGTVTDRASDATLPNVTVEATSDAGTYVTGTADDGAFDLTLPGNETAYDLSIATDGYESWAGSATLNGSEKNLDAALTGDGNLSLSLAEKHFAEPISNATITVANETYGEYAVSDEGAGEYTVANVSSAGAYAIAVDAAGYEPNTSRVATVPANGTATQDMALTGNATIEGELTDAYGETAAGEAHPIENATIEVTRSGADGSLTLDDATDANGTYSAAVPGIDATYTVNAAATYYEDASATTAALGDAASTTVDRELVGNATVSGTVTADGVQAENATIAATTNASGWDGVEWGNETADENASVAVPGTSRNYTVEATSRAFSADSATVENVTTDAGFGSLSIDQVARYLGVDDLDAPNQVEEGDEVTVTAAIVNLGTDDWNETATFHVDGSDAGSRNVSLNGTDNASDGGDGWTNTSVSFTHSPDSPGEITYGIATANETLHATVDVDESSGGGGGFGPPASSDPEPSFWLVGTALEMDELVAGETGTVTATVSNTGDGEGERELELTHDGTVVDTTTVSVPAGDRADAILEFSFDEPGEYELAVDGEGVGPVTVVEPPSDPGNETAANESAPTNDTDSSAGSDATPGFTAIAGLLALAIVAVARRR